MTGAAFVDSETISAVARALVRYGDSEQAVFAEVDAALRATIARVQAAVQRRSGELAAAEAALSACQSQPDATCTAFVAAVQRARLRLDAARQASRLVNAAAGRYQPIKTTHAAVVQALIQSGRLHLSAKLSEITGYLQSGGASTGGAHGGSVGGTPGGTISDSAAVHVLAGFPDGWAMVPLAAIDTSESTVNGPENFGKGYSPQDLSWAFQALHEVIIPALALGKSGDYFAERDQRENLLGTRSYHMTWSQFFNKDDAIRLDRRSDGSFHIGNGQHRIWVAQQRGETAVPAWIAS